MAHEPMGLPPRRDVVLISIAILGVSTSAPLIAAIAAPALAIAFWRNAMAVVALGPVALARFRPEFARLGRREWLVCVLAGVLLAAHFATWVPSVKLTSVASATALVATQPIWAAVLARLLGRRVKRVAWLGIAVGVVGVALITGVDFTISARAVTGDALAVVGGAMSAAYVTAGGSVRRTVSTTVYTTTAYSVCGLVLLVVCLVSGQQLGGYSARTWAMLVALTVAAQLIGHSLINRVLSSTSATVVSLAILFEVPGAVLLALVFLGQRPPLAAIPGLLLLLAGLAIVTRSGTRSVPLE
ncbi:MAG: DMT family transporter [Mycobacteriales bacterium]